MHKFADVIFSITQKPFYITSSDLVRYFITNKGIFLNLLRNLSSHWSLVYWKGLGSKEKRKLPFLRLFDNPLLKYLTFKIISCMQWLFWVIYQNYRGLGLAFAAHFLHDFSIKTFFIWYSIYGQGFDVIPFLLLKISNKMYYWVLI